MKRLPVRLREEAIADLQEMATYIAEKSASRKTALGFVRRIKQRCLAIGDAPNGSPLREDLGTGVRTAPFERSAVIVYRVLPECVEIVNIFYGGRDYGAIMRGGL
jgi:toxin ParE1/3/4